MIHGIKSKKKNKYSQNIYIYIYIIKNIITKAIFFFKTVILLNNQLNIILIN